MNAVSFSHHREKRSLAWALARLNFRIRPCTTPYTTRCITFCTHFDWIFELMSSLKSNYALHVYRDTMPLTSRCERSLLKVTIICRYIFLWFWLKGQFACTKFCDLCADMVKGRQFLMFDMYVTNVCEYKILRFLANPQKYQTLIPAKNSHLKVSLYWFSCVCVCVCVYHGWVCVCTMGECVCAPWVSVCVHHGWVCVCLLVVA